MSYTSKFTGAEIDAGIEAAHEAVPRSGSAMTGPLLLHDAPIEEKGAATKKYVDDAASAKAYADDKDATNLEAAKKYADEKAEDTLSQAKEHANSVVPSTLPNPAALKFTGAANKTYDGSSPVEVEIPSVPSLAGYATESYVNDKVASINIPSVEGLASEAYVDEQVGAIDIPSKLPNPNALTFTGAASGTYDGSSPITINIPAGGGSGLAHIMDGAASGSVRTSGATAEGGSYALGDGAFAEGNKTKASGSYSHAEGSNTVASNYAAHAEGTGTIAAGEDQHVQGIYNVKDADSKYLHIVGNGTSDTDRSNAHTIDRDGNAWFKGKVFVGGTGQDDPNAKELGTGGGATTWEDIGAEISEGYIVPASTYPTEDMTAFITDKPIVMPEDGEMYTVVYNGVSYESTCVKTVIDGLDVICIGNMSILGGTDTSEPFIISYYVNEIDAPMEGVYGLAFALDGAAEFSFSVFGKIKIINPIGREYLPNDVGYGAFFVDIENGDYPKKKLVDGITADDIRLAANSGRTVYLRQPDEFGSDILGTLFSTAYDEFVFVRMTPSLNSNSGTYTIKVDTYTVADDGTVSIITRHIQ